MKMERWLILASRVFIGCVFIYASIDKVLHPQAFAEIIYNYQIVPHSLINIVAIFLPWLELVIGLMLICGRCLWGGAFLANALLLVFFAALLFNLARGLNIHCGCFSTAHEGSTPTWLLVIRDFSFLLIGLTLIALMIRIHYPKMNMEVK